MGKLWSTSHPAAQSHFRSRAWLFVSPATWSLLRSGPEEGLVVGGRCPDEDLPRALLCRRHGVGDTGAACSEGHLGRTRVLRSITTVKKAWVRNIWLLIFYVLSPQPEGRDHVFSHKSLLQKLARCRAHDIQPVTSCWLLDLA